KSLPAFRIFVQQFPALESPVSGPGDCSALTAGAVAKNIRVLAHPFAPPSLGTELVHFPLAIFFREDQLLLFRAKKLARSLVLFQLVLSVPFCGVGSYPWR